jgi:hypothetical protein
MRKPVSCIAVIICLVLVLSFAGGCSAPGGENTLSEEENTFVRLLSMLPAEAKEGHIITIIDYESFGKVNGISLYDEDGKRITEEEFLDNIRNVYETGALFGLDIFVFGSDWTCIKESSSRLPIEDNTIGYSITDVNAEINNISTIYTDSGIGQYSANPYGLVAAVGDFDAKSTRDALENRGEWPSWAVDNFRSEEYKKIVIYSWVNGMEVHLDSRQKPPHLNVFGCAAPLAVTDGQLFVGTSTEDIKSAIDSSMNKGRSLADIPEYVLVARHMYDLNTVGLLVMDEELLRDIPGEAEAFFGLSSYYGPEFENFTTIGMGPGKDDKGEYMALVIVFNNPAAAEEGFSALEQKIEVFNHIYEMYDKYHDYSRCYIYDTEISIDDEVLSAKLYTGYESLWRYWLIKRWPGGIAIDN